MRVFLDENMPAQMIAVLPDHDVSSVDLEDWKGIENGELLRAIAGSFDVLLTADQSIEKQNDMRVLDLSMLVVPTNNLTTLRAAAIPIVTSLKELLTLQETRGHDHRLERTSHFAKDAPASGSRTRVHSFGVALRLRSRAAR